MGWGAALDEARKLRIGLVSCAKKKSAGPALAKDLYTSPYFRKMRTYVETTCDDWRILSSLHVLVDPMRSIAPYESTLKDMSRGEQRTWAQTAFTQLRDAFPEPESQTFEVHGGKEYTRDLVPLLRSAGYRVEEPVPTLRIGQRMAWYDRNTPIRGRRKTAIEVGRAAGATAIPGRGSASLTSEERCARIHAALAALPSFREPSADVPSDGLYLFYEDGETNAHDGSPRLVRIGNHPRRAGGLRNRLRNHYSGGKNASVFRKFLGGALMRQRDPDDPCLQPAPGQGHWEKQDARPCDRCRPLEGQVSHLLRETFRFRCVAIPDMAERNRMEEGIVASLAACPACEASAGWLGHYAYSPDVRESGLWNSNYVRGSTPLSDVERNRLEELVNRTKREWGVRGVA